MSEKKLKLAILVPSMGEWTEPFGQSFAKLQAFLFQHAVPGFGQFREIALYTRASSAIPISREELFESCRIGGDTHALMLDADQTFPPDTAHRMLAHNKPVIACNVATKTIPSSPTARLKDGTPWGAACYTDNKHGLEKVWRVGAAVMMIDLSILPIIGEGLFEFIWNPNARQYRGEDWSLCKKLEENGIDILIDHDLSRQIGHVGTYIYTQRDVLNPATFKARAA